jgi:hypothetical protein
MSTIPQNTELLKNLFELLHAHRRIFKQERTYQRVVALVLAELFVFARHTVTQLLMSLGQTETDWSGWYRVWSARRFRYEQVSAVLFKETLKQVGEDEVYVVAGDATQTPRSSRKLEGAGWLRTPPFMVGIQAAQRWFNGSWLVPEQGSYSRALPIHWQPAFTEKSKAQVHEPKTESEAALDFLVWLREQLTRCGRAAQRVLFIGDGHYDNLTLWQALSHGVTLLARSAKNRVLYHPAPSRRGLRCRPAGGVVRRVGRSTPSGALTALPSGSSMNFTPCVPRSRLTGVEKSCFCLRSATRSLPPPVPERFCILFACF